jgi:hypothetical protein
MKSPTILLIGRSLQRVGREHASANDGLAQPFNSKLSISKSQRQPVLIVKGASRLEQAL